MTKSRHHNSNIIITV